MGINAVGSGEWVRRVVVVGLIGAAGCMAAECRAQVTDPLPTEAQSDADASGASSLSLDDLLNRGKEAKDVKDIFSLRIPAELGQVKEVYKGDPNRVIVHIQDAHAHYECQRNIARIMDLLVEEYGVHTACLEGCPFGPLDLSRLSSFPNDDIRTEVMDYFTREAQFNGAQYLVVTRGQEYPLRLFGIENEDEYQQALKLFQDNAAFKPDAMMCFADMRRCLNQLRRRIYRAELEAFAMHERQFAAGVIKVDDYCRYLSGLCRDVSVPVKDFRVFSTYVTVVNLESQIDFQAAEAERNRVMADLTPVLTDEQMQQVLDMAQASREQTASVGDYLQLLRKLAEEHAIDMAGYGNLLRYIEYTLAYEQVKTIDLFDEIAQVEDAVADTLMRTPAERTCRLLLRGVDAMERMVTIKMVNRDLAFYDQHRTEFDSEHYIAFITEQAERLNLPVSLQVDIEYLDVYMPNWSEFYHRAAARNETLLANTGRILQQQQQKVVMMQVGGFHTRELTRMMREDGFSYLVITPRVTQTEQTPYLDRMLGKQTQYEQLLERHRQSRKSLPGGNEKK